MTQQVERVYLALDEAIRRNVLIEREGTRDKEFHFQEWFQARLDDAGIKYTTAGRNSYPDYSLTDSSEGFEIKGLAHPGRVADFDANSQMPTGLHNGRTIYYVFGRYPKVPEGNEYPVIDLVLCHGDLLNADKHYVHKNRSIRGFGSYGDILIRDRKMYVVPTPFALLEYTAFRRTLILPQETKVRDEHLRPVASFSRAEAETILCAYEFDLKSNELVAKVQDNPQRGSEHQFIAYRYVEDHQESEEFSS